MPLSYERLGEYIAALTRLRQETENRVSSLSSGACRVHMDGEDVTDKSLSTARIEVAQLDWLIDQLTKGQDAQRP